MEKLHPLAHVVKGIKQGEEPVDQLKELRKEMISAMKFGKVLALDMEDQVIDFKTFTHP